MLICHSCGTPVERKTRQCHHCHNIVSAKAAVGLLEPETDNPLTVQLELQPTTLDNLIASDLIKAAGKSNFVAADLSRPLARPYVVPIQEKGDNGHNSQGDDKAPDFFEHLPEMFRKNIPVQEENMSGEVAPWIDEQPKSSEAGAKAGESSSENSNKQADINRDNAEEKSVTSELIAGDNGGEQLKTAKAEKAFDSSNNGEKGVNKASLTVDVAASTVSRRSFSAWKESKESSFNLQSSWPKYLALGLAAIFLLFQGFQTLYIAGKSLLANSSNVVTLGGPSLSGRWQFAARCNNASCQGQMIIHQHGTQIFGEGIDNGLSHYRFTGNRNGDHIDILKQYLVGNTYVGHITQMQGDMDPGNKPTFMHGEFKIDYMQGGKWRGKPVVINGIWEAQMVQPLIEDDSVPADVPLLRKVNESPSSSFGSFGSYLAKNGIWIVLVGVVLGWGAWHTMSSLIGPDGWFGIWDKQKYVPPQFMKEHKIEKKQLSRPLVPGSLPLGQRWEWQFWKKYLPWIPKDLAIPPDVRVNNPHVLILGGGEKGKSRLMANMITHDIESADRAVVVVDSDGDLADLLLRWIAGHPDGQQLAKRVVVIDPTANTPSPSFNPLEWPEDTDMQNAASAIVHGFKAIFHEPPGSQNQWSPQTAHILRNSAMLLMANGKTLIDLPTLLQDNDFRDIMLEKVEKRRSEKVEFATLLETWGQYKRLARTEQWINWAEPILNRVGSTLTNLRIRPILTQPQGDVDLKKIIVDKKILIVKIPKGQLHDDANLLGSLIVTGLKQAAITLCTEGKVIDRTAAMYLDEFDNFIEKETLDAITTETKKFQLGFVGSTKTLQHMPEDFRNQIVINIGTMCVFALSKKDGDMIGPQMFRVSGRKAKHRTLMNILNKVNTSPQFELISDEEKYNIDRILGQTERQFYAYRVGTVAGTFRMKCHDFNDIVDSKVDKTLLESMYKNR